MSTIKSSDEHLTLNADGSSKDIKFQANGVEKASISSAGAFTSTTIDATKLTGDLPAISGASLTGVADATKLPLAGGTLTGDLLIDKSANNARLTLGGGYVGQIKFENNPVVTNWMVTSQYVKSNAFEIIPSTAVGGDTFTTPVLQITSDGRGISQFTAHAWVNLNQTGTQAIRDSHNVSSISDEGTGVTKVNYSNNLGNSATDSCTVGCGKSGAFISQSAESAGYWQGESRNASDNNEDTTTFTAVVFGD